MKLKKYILSLNKSILIIFLLSLIFILLKLFAFDYYPEFFTGAYKLGLFFENISYAIVTSTIFYFVVVHIQKIKDRENLKPYLSVNLNSIVREFKIIFFKIKNPGLLENIPEPIPTESVIKDILNKIDPCKEILDLENSKRVLIDLSTYIDKYFNGEIIARINNIYLKIPNLQSELKDILFQIETNSFCKNIKANLLLNVSKEKRNVLSQYEKSFIGLVNSINKLEEWIDRNGYTIDNEKKQTSWSMICMG